MKNTLAVIAALMGAAVSSYAAVNATIAANNYGANAGQIKTDTGALLPTTAWVQVFATPTGGAQTSLGAAFHPSEPGYFDNGVQTIPGATAASTVSFTVQAWIGTDYASASLKGSSTWSQATGTWDDTPPAAPPGGPDMNMPGFSLSTSGPVIPEPSTLALAALGAAALLIRRRK